MQELLVVLDATDPESALDRLRSRGVVTGTLSPRLALVAASPDEADDIARVRGVRSVHSAGGSAPDVPDLNPDERLFVESWRKRAEPKTRPGEGLPWDAPGFLPPDGPTQPSGR